MACLRTVGIIIALCCLLLHTDAQEKKKKPPATPVPTFPDDLTPRFRARLCMLQLPDAELDYSAMRLVRHAVERAWAPEFPNVALRLHLLSPTIRPPDPPHANSTAAAVDAARAWAQQLLRPAADEPHVGHGESQCAALVGPATPDFIMPLAPAVSSLWVSPAGTDRWLSRKRIFPLFNRVLGGSDSFTTAILTMLRFYGLSKFHLLCHGSSAGRAACARMTAEVDESAGDVRIVSTRQLRKCSNADDCFDETRRIFSHLHQTESSVVVFAGNRRGWYLKGLLHQMRRSDNKAVLVLPLADLCQRAGADTDMNSAPGVLCVEPGWNSDTMSQFVLGARQGRTPADVAAENALLRSAGDDDMPGGTLLPANYTDTNPSTTLGRAKLETALMVDAARLAAVALQRYAARLVKSLQFPAPVPDGAPWAQLTEMRPYGPEIVDMLRGTGQFAEAGPVNGSVSLSGAALAVDANGDRLAGSGAFRVWATTPRTGGPPFGYHVALRVSGVEAEVAAEAYCTVSNSESSDDLITAVTFFPHHLTAASPVIFALTYTQLPLPHHVWLV